MLLKEEDMGIRYGSGLVEGDMGWLDVVDVPDL